MNNAFLYVATGEGYLEECLRSAVALIAVDQSAMVYLYTDSPEINTNKIFGDIDRVLKLDNPQNDFSDKIQAMLACEAKKIIFLDTDTLPLQAFNLWNVLDNFDLAFVYDPIRWDFDLPQIPEAFPTPNTGFLAFRKTDKVVRVLERWLEIYNEQMAGEKKPLHDQPAFRQAVYESELRFLVLPEEYNLRVSFAHMVPGNVRVKLLHGRHEKLEKAIEATRRVEFQPRVYGGIYRKWELFDLLKQNLFKRLKYKSKIKRTSFINKD
jgi:hypothetical protein